MNGPQRLNRKCIDEASTSSHEAIIEVDHHGLSYAFLYDHFSGQLSRLGQYDAVIIECTRSVYTLDLVMRIRSFFEHNVYIMPIFLRRSTATHDSRLQVLTDGCVKSFQNLAEVGVIVHDLQAKISQIRRPWPVDQDSQIIHGLLAYTFTRDQIAIEPILDRDSSIGYFYSLLGAIDVNKLIQTSTLSLLTEAENLGFLNARQKETTYVCNTCSDGFLQYREVCPSCLSSDIFTEEIVHHFRCAHVAPLSDFKLGVETDRLQCPKCNHDLKHIGVDFDKPSSMHECRNCTKTFQHYQVRARCTSCSHDQKVEHLVKLDVKSFYLTDKAIGSLQRGVPVKASNGSSQVPDTMPWELFLQGLAYEGNKSKVRNHLAVVTFHDFESFTNHVGKNNRSKVLSEIISVIKPSQQSIDFRSVRLPKIYFTLLDTKLEDAENICQRTVFLLNHLLRDNFSLPHSVLTCTTEKITDENIKKLHLEPMFK